MSTEDHTAHLRNSPGREIPRTSFGIITDVQYANAPNGSNFTGDKVRYFRNSINILSEAVRHWNSEGVSFVLQLGDLIDGSNRRTDGASEESLAQVIEVFSHLKCPVYHATGNHELYNFKRTDLKQTPLYSAQSSRVCCPADASGNYYHFSPVSGFRVIVLDTYDTSLLGLERDCPEYRQTLKFFRQYNPNEDVNDTSGLPKKLCMYAAYNGAVSEKQLKWLEETLRDAVENKEKVIVAGHDPVCVGSTVDECLCWNHDSVLACLQRHGSCVLAYFAGHDHSGGYFQDESGISYLTVPGVVDTQPGTSCHITAHVFEDRMKIDGLGVVPSHVVPIKM